MACARAFASPRIPQQPFQARAGQVYAAVRQRNYSFRRSKSWKPRKANTPELLTTTIRPILAAHCSASS
eukprot:3888027-Amphidinium_carterae.1